MALATSASAFEGMLTFRDPEHLGDINHGFVVDFTVAPSVGDHLTLDPMSAKYHTKKVCHWTVVEVTHSVDLEPNKDPSEPKVNPKVILDVMVEPRTKFSKKELERRGVSSSKKERSHRGDSLRKKSAVLEVVPPKRIGDGSVGGE